MQFHIEGPPTQYYDDYKHRPQPFYPFFKQLGYEKEIARTWTFLKEFAFVTVVILVVIVTMSVVYSVAPFKIGKEIASSIFAAFTVLTIGIGFAFNSTQVHKGNKWKVHDTLQKSLAEMHNNLECHQAYRMLTTVSTTVKLTPASKTKTGYFGIYKILQPLDDKWQLDDNGRTNFKVDIHEVALALVNHKSINQGQTHDLYDPALIWYHISDRQCVYLDYQTDIRRQVCTLLVHLAHISHLMEIAGYRVHDVPVLREWIEALVPIGETTRIRTVRVMLYRVLWTYIATNHAKIWHDLRRLAVQYHVLSDVEIETYFQPLDAPHLWTGHIFGYWTPPRTNLYTLESLFRQLEPKKRKQKQLMKYPTCTNTPNVEAQILIHVFAMKFMGLDKHFFEVYEYSGDRDTVRLTTVASTLWRLTELTAKTFHPLRECSGNHLQLNAIVSLYKVGTLQTEDIAKNMALWLGFAVQNDHVVGIVNRYRVTIQLSFKEAQLPQGTELKVWICGNLAELGDGIPEKAQQMSRKARNLWEVRISPELDGFLCSFRWTYKQDNGRKRQAQTRTETTLTAEEIKRGYAKLEIDQQLILRI